MDADTAAEAQQILYLSRAITARLDQLGFKPHADTRGNIIHHLAEAAVLGKKLAKEHLPRFLDLPLDRREELAQLLVDMNYELTELKEAIGDMEPALVELMNFVSRD